MFRGQRCCRTGLKKAFVLGVETFALWAQMRTKLEPVGLLLVCPCEHLVWLKPRNKIESLLSLMRYVK